ncbi:hypothetical protein DB30_04094 [Enhygromyxa salina]|uniref:Uncharacterized protein n=1 Tax=Enhygromyxa salina TaxID=215803 RepID=A0A0C2D4Z1_9BACT|nr:hypothetical protein DB30_04094 [Enhygromyxa salina]
MRDVYMVQLDSWDRMEADLVGQIIANAGSVRQAAKPRATLGACVKRYRGQTAP